MSSLDWKGDELKVEMRRRMAEALGQFALVVEGESKKELTKGSRPSGKRKHRAGQGGHGVVTGTLRRSIHTAAPGYEWSSDDVEPSNSTPERGKQNVKGVEDGTQITVEVGSGLSYALPVHQGHHTFEGYHFLTNGLERAKGQLGNILAKFKVER